ncbi:MAG: SMP-30/gluconolactonase/LRE family protein, partial [Hypericibacter sp.]
VEGRGIQAFDRQGKRVAQLETAGGVALGCVTAIAVASDGTIYATDGSRRNSTSQWLVDLMQNRAGSGRLVACAADLSGARVLCDGLSWPAGVAVSHDESEVLLAEAWSHRLSAVAREDGAVHVLVKNFVGYPCRIARSSKGGYWVAFFALRTQLTEFILREPAFRMKMMAQVEPDLWIGPSLGGRLDYREPTQIGRIKKLGIQKPWAPARSYGLVARLEPDGSAAESLHSRVSGSLHGITAVAEVGAALIAVSKGHGKLASVPLTSAGEGAAA